MEEKKREKTVIEEPSVLDFVKSRVFFWRGERIDLPPLLEEDEGEKRRVVQAVMEPEPMRIEGAEGFPVRMVLALLLFLFAQVNFSAGGVPALGSFVGILGLAALVWAYLKGEIWLAAQGMAEVEEDHATIKLLPFLGGILVSIAAFMQLEGNQFTFNNVLLWWSGLGLMVWAVWKPGEKEPWYRRFEKWVKGIKLDWITVLAVGAMLVSVFYRVHQFGEVVPEMVSDHAEKLLDIADVLDGQRSIFFPRNTGRESLQMYLTVWVIQWFETGISFMSLKIGTVLAGVLMLPYMYLLGKEVGNKWVGLFALFLAGVAIWPNALARVGLRFILYPALTAPTLYYLLKGLRTSRRNDYILAGLFLGVGLHGYTPFRIVPLLVLVAVGLYMLHKQSEGARNQTMLWLGLLVFVSLIVFLPLLRYWFDFPESFAYRAFSRVGGLEQELPGPVWQVFLSNLWRGLQMMNVDQGTIWVVGLAGRPALDIVSGGLFLMGVVMLALRYVRTRYWQDLFLLLAVPVLMLPSILSLAFPDENPAPNRGGGTMVAVFLIAALALEAVLRAIREKLDAEKGPTVMVVVGAFLLVAVAGLNYDLTFGDYKTLYTNGAWNTSEMGGVIAEFVAEGGDPDSAWVVAFPHWVDNRLVGINAGFPRKNYELWKEAIVDTQAAERPLLFLYMPKDTEAAPVLEAVYPEGWVELYASEVEGKSFYIYHVDR